MPKYNVTLTRTIDTYESTVVEVDAATPELAIEAALELDMDSQEWEASEYINRDIINAERAEEVETENG